LAARRAPAPLAEPQGRSAGPALPTTFPDSRFPIQRQTGNRYPVAAHGEARGRNVAQGPHFGPAAFPPRRGSGGADKGKFSDCLVRGAVRQMQCRPRLAGSALLPRGDNARRWQSRRAERRSPLLFPTRRALTGAMGKPPCATSFHLLLAPRRFFLLCVASPCPPWSEELQHGGH
jgi:hypothetical protein